LFYFGEDQRKKRGVVFYGWDDLKIGGRIGVYCIGWKGCIVRENWSVLYWMEGLYVQWKKIGGVVFYGWADLKIGGRIGVYCIGWKGCTCSGRRLAIEGGLKARCLMKGYREVKQRGDVSLHWL
jgi:hypothetical protein